MKAQERRHLKENEFAATTIQVVETLRENRDRVVMWSVAIIAIVAIGGGYWYWHKHTNDEASSMLGIGMSIAQAPVVPPPTLPGATQTAGTYPTDQARQEAALQAFQQVATQYPSSPSGLAARYQMGVALLALGRLPEAEQAFSAVADKGGTSLYGSMAKLGRAETLRYQGKFDDAIKALTDLAADRDGMLPVDGVLMQLAETCLKAGKTQEARAAFKRVVDEFPDSGYVAEARQQLTNIG
ncbi:MAG TPA: tetratricopeptide repeat protein [Vicinamibacterales bacterium]|nr:tetratricopeptide repeat protein [Vicinamibacterales bacterium]